MRYPIWRLVLALQILLGLTCLTAAHLSAQVDRVFDVNSSLDEIDDAPGDYSCHSASGVCTLRAAIGEANALGSHAVQVRRADILIPSAPQRIGPVLVRHEEDDVRASLRACGARRRGSGGSAQEFPAGSMDWHGMSI